MESGCNFSDHLSLSSCLTAVWYHFQPRLIFILLRRKEMKVSSLANRAAPALSPLGMPCRTSEQWFGAVRGIKTAAKNSEKLIRLSFHIGIFYLTGESVFTECVNTINALLVGGWACVWGPYFYQLTYFTKHFVLTLDLVIWCDAPLCGSVQQPCVAGTCRSGGERTGCHHCCVFKNSLQAAFQITSAAN